MLLQPEHAHVGNIAVRGEIGVTQRMRGIALKLGSEILTAYAPMASAAVFFAILLGRFFQRLVVKGVPLQLDAFILRRQ